MVEEYFFCPHATDSYVMERIAAGRITEEQVAWEYVKQCDCRKPAPGMIIKAFEYLELENDDVDKFYMIGDRASDLETAINFCRGVGIGVTAHSRDKNIIKLKELHKRYPHDTFIVDTMNQAAEVIYNTMNS